MGILSWLKDNQIATNKKGKEIEYSDHGFLMAYLLDESERIVVRKCTQVGASLQTLFKVFYQGAGQAINCIYTLPTNPEARSFVFTKVDPIIENSPGLREKVRKVAFSSKPIYSSTLKKIGDSFYFFRGSWSSWQAQSIDADILVLDELDQCKTDILDQYEERLKGSVSKNIIYYLGNPTIPGFGISEQYDNSDQCEWNVKCEHCNEIQTITWPESIDEKARKFICKKCHKELTLKSRSTGEWMAKFRSRSLRGYQISRLIAPWETAGDIIDSYRNKTKRHFYNYVLGLPYMQQSEVINEETIRGCIGNYEERDHITSPEIVMGIDQGDEFHVIVGIASPTTPKVVSARIAKNRTELEDLLNLYKPQIVVMDMLPNKHLAKELQLKYGKQTYLLANERDYQASTMEKWLKYDRTLGVCHIERTESIDRVIERLKKGRDYIQFPKNLFLMKTVINHLSNLVPDYQERFGKVRKVWKKSGPDHLAHALNFFLSGAEILRPSLSDYMMTKQRIDKEFPQAKSADPDYYTYIEKLTGQDSIIIKPKNYGQ